MTSKATKLGYVRVSTGKQDEALQHEALDKARVLKRNRYTDHGVSGSKIEREGLSNLLADARAEREQGYEVTISVYKLDRLGRSTAHVAGLIHDLTEQGIFIESISDGLNSSTPTGRAMLQMLSIFAEMERSFIIERTRAGLAAKREQGIVGGRPKATDTRQMKQAQALRDAGSTPTEIAKVLAVSVATVYRITKPPAKV